MLDKTPLNDIHREAGARMVDFGGWDMPVHYGSQVEEHHAVRRDAGMFDVSHMQVVDVKGEGARAFLRALLANDVDRLKTPGKALYSCMLNDRGGVVDDLITYRFGDGDYRIVVNAGTARKDLAWMRAALAKGGGKCTLTHRPELAIVAVQGPNAREKFWSVFPATRAATEPLVPFSAAKVGEMMVGRTGYTGEDGFEVILPATLVADAWMKLAAAGVRPAGLGARDTLRLEAGMNLYGQDMDEDVSPLDAGLAWTVSDTPDRDFTGKRAMASKGQSHDFKGLLLLEAGGVLRAHQKVQCDGGEGEITSGTFSPTMGKSIALVRLPKGTPEGATVRVMVRDKALAARVVKPPFVRHGKILVT